jgi:hypothetical protein
LPRSFPGRVFSQAVYCDIDEADESAFWLELLVDAQLVSEAKLKDLKSEANQLVAIFNASRVTAKKGSQSAISNQKSTIPHKIAS